MRTERHSPWTSVKVASALLAILFLAACQQTQPPASAPVGETKPATTNVYVIFAGPWGIVPDPKDANSVIALAPKTKSHFLLGVSPASTKLQAGIYDLQIPVHGAATATFDKRVLRTNVDPQAVQHALDNRLERYAIRLPRPEAYLAETRHVARVGPTYPPDASTELDYVTSISLRYAVPTLTGFQLTGTPDEGGAFPPQLLSLDTPTIRFEINPSEETFGDPCHMHARRAFHDLTHLLGVTLYIDYPDSSADCRKKDPQTMTSKARLLEGWPLLGPSGILGEEMRGYEAAGIASPFLDKLLDSAIYRVVPSSATFLFFHAEDCEVPPVVGGGG